MTKSEFVDQVASRADLGKSEAGKAVDAVLDTIQETLSRGSDVTFSGFGKFHVAERGARQGVHPRTGEPIQIRAPADSPNTPTAAVEARKCLRVSTSDTELSLFAGEFRLGREWLM